MSKLRSKLIEAISNLKTESLPERSYDWEYDPKTDETLILDVKVVGRVPGDHTKEDFETFMRKYYY